MASPRYPKTHTQREEELEMNADDIPKWQRPEPVEEHRTNIVKVRLTDSELNLIKEKILTLRFRVLCVKQL